MLAAPHKSPLAWLLLLSPFFFWGTAMVAMKGSLPHTTPFFLAGLRLVPAGLLVVATSLWLGRSQPKTYRAWLWIVAFALVDGTLFQGFLAQGLARTSAGLGSVTIDSQPLAVALLASWLYGEHIGAIGWLGLVVGLGGIALVGLPEAWLQQAVAIALRSNSVLDGPLAAPALGWPDWAAIAGGFSQSGTAWMLLAALSMATGTVMVRTVSRYADPIAATGWHMVLGGLPLFAVSSLSESDPWSALTGGDWGAIAYSTIFGSALAYGLFFYFASQGNVTSLSALTFLTPIFALLFGHWLLSETLTSIQAIGVGLTLVSIYLVNQREAIATRLGLQPRLSPPELTEVS